eukprot:GFKZ01003265.1.p1 GENE.GFKZ01003265.1~~GFKZ01003265.1.p1  ORF type:complete len:495 (-),score=58.15 GFKZ01003265.1:300-1784(-)
MELVPYVSYIAYIALIPALPLLLIPLCAVYHFLTAPAVPGPSFLSEFRSSLRKNSHQHALARLWSHHLTYGPVFTYFIAFNRVIASANPRDIAQIHSLPRPHALVKTFTAALPGGLFAMTPKKHASARKMMASNFHSDLLRPLHGRFSRAIKDMCSRIAEEKGVQDISTNLCAATVNIITNVAFDFDLDYNTRLRISHLIDQIVAQMGLAFAFYPLKLWLAPLGTMDKMNRAKKEVEDLFSALVEKRIKAKEQNEHITDDLLSVILNVHESKELVTSLVFEFALTGTNSTAHLVAWGLYETAIRPHVKRKIEQEIAAKFGNKSVDDVLTVDEVAELSYLRMAWKEVLRMHTATVGTLRVATEDVVLKGSGTAVRKGSSVLAFNYGMQRSGTLWRDADSFCPERWEKDSGSSKFLPYAMGEFSCIGKFLAEYEGPLLLAEIYRRFDFELACAADEVVNCSMMSEMPRSRSRPGGDFDQGVPMRFWERRGVAETSA